MALSFVQKRLLLDEDEDGGQQPHENQENVDPQWSAKRFKKTAVEQVKTPMQRLLDRQMVGSAEKAALTPVTALSQSMQMAQLEGTPKTSMGDRLLLRHKRAIAPPSPEQKTGLTMRAFNSVSSCCSTDSNSMDDEYMTMLELQSASTEEDTPLKKLPNDLDALITGRLKEDPCLSTPDQLLPLRSRSRRCLSMSRKEDNPLSPFSKTLSMNDADIMSALARDAHADEPELIGDLSKPCALPLLQVGVRHPDLKTISCDTLARLLRGQFEELVTSYHIIDCRYPYEYKGGHIVGAKNLYTHEHIIEAFPALRNASTVRQQQRNIFIFHCEFSSERGPKFLRFLRSNDRSQHTNSYPHLDYPELYLLHNGYKEFFEQYAELCTPRNYIPMLEPLYNEEFRHFRAKTKSWQSTDHDHNGSSAGGVATNSRPLKKSRSRLLYSEF
ncbi:cdc25-like protein phosphatase twine [Scaptodrosophila lebanonensis]|uniref:protein-tyrosine-phosphatase n=1 Tax=Drosophila lebanonensis TaxID=7225 RepID=A0A6J2TRL0_DROLE|nr:cdc25-like protein phosphatase twine [Scaptodrosophila lebanonensis]XP_030377598.1 cdc25-like protein phosphatase twine [Scaptodrosophila lebanonensis]